MAFRPGSTSLSRARCAAEPEAGAATQLNVRS
jgi:hypothetical protein